jgi:hypothetical protein
MDSFGNVRIIHAYATADDAQKAIGVMRQRSPGRYVVVAVENQPAEHWGINVPGSAQIPTPFARVAPTVSVDQPVAVDESVAEPEPESVVAPEPAVEPEPVVVEEKPKLKTARRKK